MPNHNPQTLRRITSFPALVEYLRDELDWPIEVEDAEDLVFEYTPEELGLAPQHAVKVECIKQVRPLSADQPWGIFYLQFEAKRLPIVVMRRILRALIPQTRNRRAEQPVWQLEDLLFISTFGGETTPREIAFAHFHQTPGQLPTLRVLGWDGADTPLKLDHVAATLREQLRWPAAEDDAAAWREQWTRAFRHRVGHVIRTADALADRLALLARNIREAAATLMALEAEHGPLRRLHAAFQTALIHDLTEADFADTYAQTVAYGLLTAAIQRTPPDGGRHDTTLYPDMLAEVIPITNPFLREMLQTFLRVGGQQGGIDFDELGIQDVVDLLRGDETDLPAILRDFGNRARGEDPVIHFYEHFLSAYNKQLKVQRGVFYTPQPVVSYIVRSVHELLQTEFGLEDGLADTTTWGELRMTHHGLCISEGVAPETPFVQILDPATGTATFLVEVIDVIYQHLQAKWTAQGMTPAQRDAAWNEYVPRGLLPRLYGYELMMAPYAIAHMKIGLKLSETRYRFGSDARVQVYLTNALEPATDGGAQLEFAELAPALAHEAQAVNEVKRAQRFTVVVGNPPYAYESSNTGEWISSLVRDYYQVDGAPLGERNPKGLQDDYVKFIRLGQWRVAETGAGILAYITNHGYLDNPTFRGMRQSLLADFDQINALDLHGNSKKKETTPEGGPDENVFDIMSGVAIVLAVKRGAQTSRLPKSRRLRKSEVCAARHADLWGLREKKYTALRQTDATSTAWTRLQPSKPFYFFIPQNIALRGEYKDKWSITDIFPLNSVGLYTARDALAIQFTFVEMRDVVNDFASLDAEDARNKYGLGKDSRDWKVSLAQSDILSIGKSEQKVQSVSYRPFDVRFTYYTGNSRGFVCMPRPEVMQHLLSKNLALCFIRRSRDQTVGNFYVARFPVDKTILSSLDNANVAPLYLYPDPDAGLFDATSTSAWPPDPEHGGRVPNFDPQFVAALETQLGLTFAPLPKSKIPNPKSTFSPADIFHYAYAVFHSPTYRERYAEFLKIDFPRLPLTSDVGLFRALAHLGADLVALHLLEDAYPAASWNHPPQSPRAQGEAGSPLQHPITTFVERETGAKMGKFSKRACYDAAGGRVYLDTSQRKASSYFEGVPEDVWEFQIGGYQVLHKWLYDRRKTPSQAGRVLTAEDIAHYQRIVVALQETMRLMAEIDAVIESHGGWPVE